MNIKTIIALTCSLYINAHAQHSKKDNLVGYTTSIQSKIMNDKREIQIFLPDSYEDSDKSYPVLYILDGQRYFLLGVSLQKSFVEFRQAPEFIVAGISKNPSDRNRNFSVNSENYLKHIKEEVIEYVDSQFRTSKKRILFGWAYGGGFAIKTMLLNADLFDTYIVTSPFPLEDKIEKLDQFLSENPNFNKRLYFTSGTNEGLVRDGAEKLNKLLSAKAPKTMNWTFRELEGEEHRSTPYPTLYHGIKKTFNYYPELQFSSLEEFSKSGGLEYVYDYYQKRATEFAFSKDLSDWTMFTLTRNAIRATDYKQFTIFINEFEKTGFIERLRISRSCTIAEFYLENKNYDKAIDLFTILIEKHPSSERALTGLGDTYKELKNDKKASIYYNRVKKLTENN